MKYRSKDPISIDVRFLAFRDRLAMSSLNRRRVRRDRLRKLRRLFEGWRCATPELAPVAVVSGGRWARWS